GTVYFSFLLNLSQLPTGTGSLNNTTGDFFFSLNNTANNSQTGNPSVAPGRVQIRRHTATSTTQYDIEILVTIAATSTYECWYKTGINTGATQFIVGSYDLAAKTANLWVNPSTTAFGLSQAPGADKTSTAGGSVSPGVGSALIFERTSLNLTGLKMDELRVA